MKRSRAIFLAVLAAAVLQGCATEYSLLSPDLRGLRRSPIYPASLRVKELVRDRIAAGDADHISVYFHALQTGYWFGVDEKEKFIPASLLKMYLMIGVLKEAEKDPSILKRRIKLADHERGYDPVFPPSKKLVPGRLYTVDELLGGMISYSDNNAANNLFAVFNDYLQGQVYSDFGIAPEGAADLADLTVKQYMMAFLSLYNSTYLSLPMSQKALEYLARSDFGDGLAAGLPHGVTVAHKFGERAFSEGGDGMVQLHDCGIVYHPEFPYMLGVMTRGKDMKKLAGIIRDVSKLVYEEVSSRDPGRP
ncbi:MAG: class A beta-lactamase-related serine hydrolase [Elusimicrobia bacterium]|nr:class A beta-lactamase-related serine hydrolase [Elusimicrobiota bacterium]